MKDVKYKMILFYTKNSRAVFLSSDPGFFYAGCAVYLKKKKESGAVFLGHNRVSYVFTFLII